MVKYSYWSVYLKLCIPWYISDKLVNLIEVSVQSEQNGFIIQVFHNSLSIVYIVSYPWKYEVPQLGPQRKLSKETT